MGNRFAKRVRKETKRLLKDQLKDIMKKTGQMDLGARILLALKIVFKWRVEL